MIEREVTSLYPRIQKVLLEICESHFKPAVRNLKLNLGEENVPYNVLEDVCISVLESAKELFTPRNDPKRQIRGKCPNQVRAIAVFS